MQHFVDGFVEQCRRHQLRAELILVEWNPPSDRPPLRNALRFPENTDSCEIKIITVPADVHNKMEGSQHLPLYQMIAKNVGIRRARGRFVLATNIDILFSDQVIRLMRDELVPGKLYRVNRFDVPPDVPVMDSFDKTLAYCDKTAFRVHRITDSYVRHGRRWVGVSRRTSLLRHGFELLAAIAAKEGAAWSNLGNTPIARKLIIRSQSLAEAAWRWFKRVVWKIRHRIKLHVFREVPHTNACGDFTLMSRADWSALRGYPEWQIFSWHLDSILLYQAMYAGIRELDLPDRYAIYHIEHGVGSGYTPEGASELFSRLSRVGLRYLTDGDVQRLVGEMKAMRKDGRRTVYNDEQWGLASESFHEQRL